MDKKAKSIKECTEKCRRQFNLPETEDCIQNYSCIWGGGKGRLYITQNNLCWASALTSTSEKIPFRKVQSITAARSLGLVGNAIDIKAGSEEYHWSGFLHRDEALQLMLHIWKHPPQIISLQYDSHSGSSSSSSSASYSSSPSGGGSGFAGSGAASAGRSSGTGPVVVGGWGSATGGAGSRSSGSGFGVSGGRGGGGGGGGWGDYGGGGGQTQITADMVNTGEGALRLAYQTREIGIDTIEELERQAEQIDRIERGVENIHSNLDKGDRMIRGIESLGGHFVNQVTSQKKRDLPTFQERKIEWAKKRPDKLEIPILEKLSNDSFAPGFLKFEDNTFSATNESGREQKGKRWPYSAVKEVAIRSRPLHLDVRFGKDRFRLCSSLVQAIVNEFYFRVDTCSIIFEPGAKKFDYGSDMIVATSTSRNQSTGTGGGAYFGVRSDPASILSDNVSEEVKEAVRQQDKNVDQIRYLVGEMGNMGIAMGVEIERQNEQLGRVTTRVDQASERLHNANNRLARQL